MTSQAPTARTQPSATGGPSPLRAEGGGSKLICRDVWKLFGANAAAFLSANPRPDDEALAAANLVGAVRAINLDVHEGECFVIMGLSGSGKSTLVRCLSRLIEPTSGEILFNGENLLAADERRMIDIRRRQMGMVFQHFALLPHLSVLDNVAFPLSIQGVDRARREDRARQMIDLVGLGGREAFFPRQLSGGQQQRVGIARSLAVEPELWFLDEPFSALDPLIRREMQDEFLRLQSVLKKTIVFITHDFDEAIRLADRIAIMKDGQIEQIGTPEELVLAPATAYVAEFTRSVSRAKVVAVGSLMKPLSGEPPSASIPMRTKVADAAPLFGSSLALAITDMQGNLLGKIERDDVADMMMAG